MKEEYGYDYLTTEDGTVKAIDRRTGEIDEMITVTVPRGTSFLTPQQQEDLRRRKENEIRRFFAKSAKGVKFYFVSRGGELKGMSPETVARLIYLISYIRLEENRTRENLLMWKRRPMKREDLPAVLNVSPATVTKFWSEVFPEYINENNEGLLFNNSDLFIKGRGLTKSSLKFFVKGIQELYRITPATKHRYLGYLFQLLPYVNIEYNILCHNPLETELEDIEPMSLGEFCDLIDYDKSNLSRLLKVYRNLKFSLGDQPSERFVSFVYDGLDRDNARVFINPNILYSGTRGDKVAVLGAFCQ